MMKTTIIVVDDDSSVRDGLTALLEAAGYVVHSYASGDRFLQSDLPQSRICLLLDLNMPKMDGLAVISEMKTKDIQIPTIIMTGGGKAERDIEVGESGALPVLAKPIAALTLFSTIEKALMGNR